MAEYTISPCFYPLSLMCWLERCFYKRLCVKLVMLSSLETKARLMWFKDWSDVTPSAFLTCFQTPPRELRWHQSAASERLLLCQLDVLFVRIDFIGPVSENIGIALVVVWPGCLSSLGSVLHHHVANSPQKPVGKGRQKLFVEKPIRLWTELSTKPVAVK